jgi:hypothetical protein
MPHIPYVDPSAVSDPEILGYLERARREGTPRPESQAIRANNPSVIRTFSQAWELTTTTSCTSPSRRSSPSRRRWR